MCSVTDGSDLFPEISSKCLPRSCMKCAQPSVVVVRANDAFCRECFLSYCVHKFRMSFGKSRLIRDQENVIVAVSGGPTSSAMLHLVLEGKSERAQRKLRFIPTLVHIDESCVLGVDGSSDLQKMFDKMNNTGYPFSVYKLSQVLIEGNLSPVLTNTRAHSQVQVTGSATQDQTLTEDKNEDELRQRLSGISITDCNDSEIQSMLHQSKSLTAKQSLLSNLRMQLLERISAYHNCTKVLLGDSCTRLAVHMLSNITQGRGGQLSYEMSFADTRREHVTFVRPMREFSSKEVAMYNAMNKVETIFMENLSTKASGSSSLDRLTEDFVTGLQAKFPNTVSTIFRTGEKLDVSDKSQDNSEVSCAMCQAPLDTNVGESSALSATLFSQKLCNTRMDSTGPSLSIAASLQSTNPGCLTNPTTQSTNDCDINNASVECCGKGDGSCNTACSRISLNELNSCLCYGCRLIVKDMSDYTKLPPYVFQTVMKHIRRMDMKASIEEFLLDGES